MTEPDASAAPPDYGLLDRAGISRQVFFPRRDHVPPPAGASDLLIEVEAGAAVGARFYVADPGLATILYFHGNGEVASDHDDLAPFYQKAGANLFVAEFRGYGRSGGAPTFSDLVGDAHPVAQRFHGLLDEEGFAPSRFIMGRSLGAHPALEVAARAPDRFRGLIIESGAGSMRRLGERLGPEADAAAVARLVDAHEAKLRSIQLPTLIIHGERDDLIPVEQARALADTLAHVAPELVVLSGAGHNDLILLRQREYFAAIAAFVARLA